MCAPQKISCVVCGLPVPDRRIAALERAQTIYVVHAGTWTIEGSATCSPECNRIRKRENHLRKNK
jgi:predicted nucleic acid-binding Zn ribbon protein